MYNSLCKTMAVQADAFERRIVHSSKTKCPHTEVVLDFVKSISLLHFALGNQLNSNSVTLGTKTHRIAKNRLQILKDRLAACGRINSDYVNAVQDFNRE
jgi:hypothetical protein